MLGAQGQGLSRLTPSRKNTDGPRQGLSRRENVAGSPKFLQNATTSSAPIPSGSWFGFLHWDPFLIPNPSAIISS